MQRGIRLKKTYLSFALVLVLIALALFGALTYRTQRSMRLQTEQDHLQLLQLEEERLFHFLQGVEVCGDVLSMSPRCQKVLLSRQTMDYLAFADCRDLLGEYLTAPFGLYRLDLYVLSGNTLVTSSEGVFYHLSQEEMAPLEELMANSRAQTGFWTTAWQGREPGLVGRFRNGRYLTYVREVVSLYTGKVRGLMLLSVSAGQLDEFCLSGDQLSGSISLDGELISGKQMEGNGWQTLTRADQDTGFTCTCSYLPMQPILRDRGFLLIMLLMLVLFGLLFGLLVLISERQVAGPAGRLLRGFEEVQKGDFGCRVGDWDNAFLGDVNEGFDRTAQHLQESVEALVEERTRGEELHEQLLLMQIRPHFLYNIFNSMIWLLAQMRLEDLEDLITSTATFYRTALSQGQREITLSQNMEQLRSYVSIQRYRFGDRFDLLCRLPEELEEEKVPNLLLQPLVENALTHGFEGMEGRGRVEVKAALIEGQIVLTVQDNGLGIGEGRLQELRDAMARDENSTEFFAMVNVARRLRLSFGDRAGIWVDSLAGQGTTVEIRLPSGKAREAGRGEAT